MRAPREESTIKRTPGRPLPWGRMTSGPGKGCGDDAGWVVRGDHRELAKGQSVNPPPLYLLES